MDVLFRPLRMAAIALSLLAVPCLGLGSGAPVAHAGMSVLPLAGTQFQVGVKSLRERKFDGVIEQQFDFSCGSAALATLLTYFYERPIAERDVFLRMYEVGDQENIKKLGFSLLDMKVYLDSIGLRSDGFRIDDLSLLEDAGVPVIALIDVKGYKHFVVVLGIDERGVMIGDPAVGKVYRSREEFLEMWDRIAFVIRDDGATARKYFNDARFWSGHGALPFREALDQQTLHSFTSNFMSLFNFDVFQLP